MEVGEWGPLPTLAQGPLFGVSSEPLGRRALRGPWALSWAGQRRHCLTGVWAKTGQRGSSQATGLTQPQPSVLEKHQT